MGSLTINTDGAKAALGQFKRHGRAGAEVEQQMAKSLNDFGLQLGGDGVACAAYLQELTLKIHDLVEAVVAAATSADGSAQYSAADAAMKELDACVSAAPAVAQTAKPMSVQYDELLPDLEPGHYYNDDRREGGKKDDGLWGRGEEPSVDDINQRGFGDCWLLSPLLSMTETDPDRVKALITDHGDDTYTVHLATGDVEVDGAVLAVGNSSNAKWVAIIEFATAQSMGGTYENVSGGRSANAFRDVFGSKSDTYYFKDKDKPNGADPEHVFDEIERAIDKGLPVTVSKPGHVYAVVDVADIDGERCIAVRNPWGQKSDGAKKEFEEWANKTGATVDPKDSSMIWIPADAASEVLHGAVISK